jgi:hypothetical protein
LLILPVGPGGLKPVSKAVFVIPLQLVAVITENLGNIVEGEVILIGESLREAEDAIIAFLIAKEIHDSFLTEIPVERGGLNKFRTLQPQID